MPLPTIANVTTNVSENTGTFYSASHTTSGNNRGLLAVVSNTSQSLPLSIRYGGIPLTMEGSGQEGPTGKRISIWSLIAPPTGTNALQISYSAIVAVALTTISFNDVDQTDMVGTFVTSTTSTTTPTISISATSTDLVVDGLSWGTTGVMPNAPQVQLSNHVTGAGSVAGGSSYQTGSSTTQMSWTLGASTAWVIAAVNVRGAPDTISQGPTNAPVSIFAVTVAQNSTTGTTYSFQAECSGSNRALLVVVANTTPNAPHGVQYSATSMVQEGIAQEVATGKYLSFWSLINPPAGSNPVSLSFSAGVAVSVAVFSFTNVDQFDMIANYIAGTGSDSTPRTTIPADAGNLIVQGVSLDINGNASPLNSDATLRSQNGNQLIQLATASKPASGENNLSWSLSAPDDWVLGAVAVRPFVNIAGKASRAQIMLPLQRYRNVASYDLYTFRHDPIGAGASGSAPEVTTQTTSIGPRVSLPPPTSLNEDQWKRQTAIWMSEINQGKLQNTGVITLQANAASTTVQDDRVGKDSFIGLMPRTANAATEYGLGAIYIITGKQSFTIAHANNSQDDRVFVYSILG